MPSVSPGCVMMLHTYTLSADERPTAAAMPGTSKFGKMLVYRLPGPSTMTSAAAIASNVSASGLQFGGISASDLIGDRAREIDVSPSTELPSASVACSATLASVDGKTR